MQKTTLSLLTPALETVILRDGRTVAIRHPLDGITSTVQWRLAHPTMRQRKEARAIFERTPSGKVRMHNRAKVVSNDGTLRGYASLETDAVRGTPIDRLSSQSDREEIRGCIAHACAIHGCLDDKGNPVGLSFAVWKDIFRLSRLALGMNRRDYKEGLKRSIEEFRDSDFHSELTVAPSTLAKLDAERREKEQADARKVRIIARETREIYRAIRTAAQADDSRKAKGKRKVAVAMLRRAARCAAGKSGHASEEVVFWHKGQIDTSALRVKIRRFMDYVAEGRAILARAYASEEALMHGISA